MLAEMTRQRASADAGNNGREPLSEACVMLWIRDRLLMPVLPRAVNITDIKIAIRLHRPVYPEEALSGEYVNLGPDTVHGIFVHIYEVLVLSKDEAPIATAVATVEGQSLH